LLRGTVQKVAMFPNLAEDSASSVRSHTFRLTVSYDGTDFFGWQVQPGLRTIQGTLQAGIPAGRLHRAINRRLPSAIRVVSLEEVDTGFHARTGVVNKTYEYRIFERHVAGSDAEQVCPPSVARFAWDCKWPLQLEPMEVAARAMVGTHDFASFAASDPDRTRRAAEAAVVLNNVRTVFGAGWLRAAGLLVFRVTGSGFLHHMVRNMVGTCVEAGAGRLDPAGVPEILAARDRSRAGATAPPQGLHLMRVRYAGDSSEGGGA
jgi:tRNA pseudouridine38-40 synthase